MVGLDTSVKEKKSILTLAEFKGTVHPKMKNTMLFSPWSVRLFIHLDFFGVSCRIFGLDGTLTRNPKSPLFKSLCLIFTC